jgi:hypothetical protein
MCVRACFFSSSASEGVNAQHRFQAMFTKPSLQMSDSRIIDSSATKGSLSSVPGRRHRTYLGNQWWAFCGKLGALIRPSTDRKPRFSADRLIAIKKN